MVTDSFLFEGDPFDAFDPEIGNMDDPTSSFPMDDPDPAPVVDDPEPAPIIDDPEPLPSVDPPKPSININPKIGSNNSGWPCACTGLYI